MVSVKELPKVISDTLSRLRARHESIVRTYGDLQKAGRPLWESLEEVACVFYAVKLLGEKAIADYLMMSKNALWLFMKRIQEGYVTIFRNGNSEKISVNEAMLDDIVKQLLEESEAKRMIRSIMDSKIVQDFIANPVKRRKTSPHGRFYTSDKISDTIRWLGLIHRFIVERQEWLKANNMVIPANPDYWEDSHADTIGRIIDIICAEKKSDPFEQRACKAKARLALRRIQRFKDWFSGEIGAAVRMVRPREHTLFLRHVRELSRLYDRVNSELKAAIDIAFLHIWTGAREGWASLPRTIERLKREGVNIESKKYYDLDDDIVRTSLIGIKWEKAITREGKIIGFRIWEEKTQTEWILSINWIDWIVPGYTDRLRKYYEYAREHNIKSVVKTIARYHGVAVDTVEAFRKWYSKSLKKLRKLLDLEYDIEPHMLRSAHISILAELGVHLEYAIENIGFGVGWEDLNTARVFYRRISEELLQEVIQRAQERAKTL